MVLDNRSLETQLQGFERNSLPQQISHQIDDLASKSNLTVSQCLLWLGQKLNPDVPLYNMAFRFTIGGKLDPWHFQRAFQALVERSDILRVTITEIEGIPHQQVHPTLDSSLLFLDFSTAVDPQDTAQQWMSDRCTHILDLQTCLWDSALLKLAPDQFIWYFNQHHLITDNQSVALLYEYLQLYYGRSLNGTFDSPSNIPAYLAYAEQTLAPSKRPQSQKAIVYWQQKRETLPPPVPLYGQPSETVSARTQRTYCHLGRERSQALRTLAATPEAQSLSLHQSQFNLFLTLLFAYLYRISGCHRLAIAAPAHNRPTPALKETPGLFMELFPLQVEIEPDETFTSLLQKVARESMAFLRYAQTGISHHAIDRHINVVLSYINSTFPDFHGLPSQTEWLHAGYGDAQHHLRLEVHDFDNTDSFTLQFDFNCELIPEAQRKWGPEHFCQLLDAWLENSQQQLATVDILAPAERSLILNPAQQLGASVSPPTLAPNLVQQFRQQVEQVPDQAAVIFENQALTYAELEIQSNQLAHYLGKQGVSRGTPVGLFMERSIPLIVCILGILKAGAAYLPIDPTYPMERVAFMVEDGQVSILMTQGTGVEKLPAETVQVISVEAHRAAIAQEPTSAPSVVLTPQDLAYILYTSGSTGQPKGVMVEHHNILAMLQGFEYYAVTKQQLRGTAVCSCGFDVSVWEIFSNLCFGGTVHLLPTDIVTSHDRFAQYLITHAITSAYIPPPLLDKVIQVLEQSNNVIALDRILVGVEPIQQGLLQRYRQRLPLLRIVNGYGPTETTICATFHTFDAAVDSQANTPIGRALPGYEVYLVNPQGQQVPIGMKGEILIGGAGLSRGYLNRPKLMAQKFIENPFGPGKLYKTGDQARYRSDGQLEFLGRLDHQVKVRGFRVELSEVETALSLHPGVKQAVVITQETPQSSLSLVAYLVAPNTALTSRELRDALKQKLPDYMVPSAFVVLEALPLTPNGKVDRRQLSSADYADRQCLGAEADYVAPASEWETYLAALWAQYLQVASVGIQDNFFDLGGDSITAIQIAAQATEAGLVLSPQQILQQGTIARLVTEVNPVQALPPLPVETQANIPLTPIQKAFFEQNLADPHHWNQSLLLDVTAPLDYGILTTALQRLLHHYPVLRFRFIPAPSDWQQLQPDTEPQPTIRYVDLANQSPTEQEQAMARVEAELQTQLNLEAGDLVRAALFDRGTDYPQRLLMIIHHLVVDGVSWLTLLESLESFYRQLSGEAISPPLPTTPFQRWSTGLVKAVSSGTFQSELDYWLRPARATRQLWPQDTALATAGEGRNTVASTQTITTCLDVDQTRLLLREIPKTSRAKVNEVLLTALMLAFHEQTGQSSLLIDLEGHGREESIVPDATLVRTVGWFTTVFPLLLTLPPQLDLGEQLQSVKEQLRGVPGHGIGYGLLRYLDPDAGVKEQLQTLPQAEILFNYLGRFGGIAAGRFYVPAGP